MTPLEIWIDWYQRQGIRCFPLYGVMNGICRCPLAGNCENQGKHPKVRNWQNRDTPIGSLDNIGVDTSNLVIIDVDDWLIPLSTWPTSYTTTTGKGYHVWYWASENPEYRVKTTVGWRFHVDVKAVGGLIVAPPSKHFSGKMYEPLNDEPIQPIPKVLLDVLPLKAQQAERLNRPINVESEQTSVLILPVLNDICERVTNAPQGQRNHELFRQACAVLRYMDAGQMGSDALQALADAAHTNGLTEQEILATLASAARSL